MTLGAKLKALEKLTLDNSPMLLTATGVLGVVGTAVLTHKASLKADRIIRAQVGYTTDPADRRERIELTWKVYIPPVAAGTATIAAIIFSNRISAKRAAALAAAYKLSEHSFSDYRDKVVEKFGLAKDQEVHDDIARDRMKNNPVTESNVIMVGTGDVLCCDNFTGRYFRSSMESLRKAENDTNFQVVNDGYASLSDFYERIGLPRTSYSDEVGWTTDKKLELVYSAMLATDSQPCIVFDFHILPIRGYDRL